MDRHSLSTAKRSKARSPKPAAYPAAVVRAVLLGSLVFAATSVHAEPAARVFLNGVPAPVFFNDGDSFRVLGGEHSGTRARLAGFNTLESHGPVHQWGRWHLKEMYFIAKLATLNAMRGEWHCESDGDADTYGRILWFCKDLAVDQVRRGLAHAMTVTDEPAHAEVLAAQRDAIRNKRGMWAHGVPDFVLTSLHSAAEGGGSDGRTYNRLVSTADGHSEKWTHQDNYRECEKVCFVAKELAPAAAERIAARIRADAKAAALVTDMREDELLERVGKYANFGSVGYMKDKQRGRALDDAVKRLGQTDLEQTTELGENGCMVYVDFKRRYGADKASCLK